MGFVAELSYLSWCGYHLWSSLENSLKSSKHGPLPSSRLLANLPGYRFSVCCWVMSGWLFQVSKKHTASLTWLWSPFGDWCLWQAKFDRNDCRNLSSSFAPPQYQMGSTILNIVDWFPGFSRLSIVLLWSSSVSIRFQSFLHLAFVLIGV